MRLADLAGQRAQHVCQVPVNARLIMARVDVHVIRLHRVGHGFKRVGHVAAVKNPSLAVSIVKHIGKLGLKNVERVQHAKTIVFQRGQDPQGAVSQCGTDLKHVGRLEMPQAQVQDFAFHVASQAVMEVGHAARLHGRVATKLGGKLPNLSCALAAVGSSMG